MKQMTVKQWVDYVYKIHTKRLEVIHKQEVEEERRKKVMLNVFSENILS